MKDASRMESKRDVERLHWVLPFLLLLLGSCATLPRGTFDIGSEDRSSIFTPLITKSFDARPQSPALGAQDCRALIEAGYATLERLEVIQVTKRCQPKGDGLACQDISPLTPMREAFLKEAAKNGGDLVLLEQDGRKKVEGFSRRGKWLL